MDYNKHCKYSFGEYIQAHHQNVIRNDMTAHTIDAIYLYPNYNTQGGHICMNLNTGKHITCSKVTPIPLPEVVKCCVNDLTCPQGINHVKSTNKKGFNLSNVD